MLPPPVNSFPASYSSASTHSHHHRQPFTINTAITRARCPASHDNCRTSKYLISMTISASRHFSYALVYGKRKPAPAPSPHLGQPWDACVSRFPSRFAVAFHQPNIHLHRPASSFRRPPSFRQRPVAFLRFIRWGLLFGLL